jgi:surface antigen
MNNNFKLRSTCPTTNDKNYISYKNGGFNHCIRPGDYGAKSYFTGSVLANCVGYACGRFNEIYNELTGYANGHKFPKLNCNAEGFIERAKETYGLEVSDIPVIGGIMVWQKGATLSGSDGAGHVAIVEDVIDNNTIKTSESDYDYSIYANKTWTNTNGR